MAHANRALDEFADRVQQLMHAGGRTGSADAAAIVQMAVELYGSDDDAIYRALLDLSDELHPLELPASVRAPIRALLVTDRSHGLIQAVVRYMRLGLVRGWLKQQQQGEQQEETDRPQQVE